MSRVVSSLFGIDPQQINMQRQQSVANEAMQYAQLDPSQRGHFSMYQGAHSAGRMLGGLMGGQDPEMQKAQQRQRLLQGVDISDPNALKQAAQQAMASNDYAAAQELMTKAREIEAAGLDVQYKNSQITKNNREARPQTPAEIQKAQYVAVLDQQMAELAQAEPSPERDQALAALKTQRDVLAPPEKPEKPMDFGDHRESVAQELFGKRFASLTQEQIKAVNARVEAEKDKRAEKAGTKILMPGQPVEPKDWLKFADRLDKNPTYKNSTAIISAAPQVLETIRLSGDNDIAAAALSTQLAEFSGENGTKSNQDIARFARTGGLDDRLAQSAASFFTGRTTKTKKEQAAKYVTAVFRGALMERRRQLVTNAEEFGYADTPNYKAAIANIDAQLAKFKKPSEIAAAQQPATAAAPAPAGTKKTSKGTSYTVVD